MLVSQETVAAQIDKYLSEKARLLSEIAQLKSAEPKEDTLLDLECLEHDLETISLLDIEHFLPESCRCACCGEALSLPYVYWHHIGLIVAYHLSCAEHWLPTLERDINEFHLGRSKANEILAATESQSV